MHQSIRLPVSARFAAIELRFRCDLLTCSHIFFKGYVRFSNERREELKRTCPELSVLAVTKKMAEEWNTMNIEKKKPFLDAADIDKQRYNQEMKEYQEKKVRNSMLLVRM